MPYGQLKPPPRKPLIKPPPDTAIILEERCPFCNRDFILEKGGSVCCPCGYTIAIEEEDGWKLYCSAPSSELFNTG